MKYFVAKYSNRNSTYNHELAHGKFVGIDQDSGGYPYPTTSLTDTHMWTTREAAEKYTKIFLCLDIYEITFDLKAVK